MTLLAVPKREAFAQLLARGATSIAQAYVDAGYRPHRHNAARLARDEHIRARISEVQAEIREIEAEARRDAVERVGLTKEWVLESLRENAAMAMGRRQTPDGRLRLDPSAANRAIELLGRELGMFAERRLIDQRVTMVDERAAEADRFLAESMERLAALKQAKTIDHVN